MSTAGASGSVEEPPPPLRFRLNRHQNMKVSPDGSIARRTNTNFFTRGLIFGTRPVKINEKINFKLMELAENLGGFVYVGFTSRDPENLQGVTCQHLAKSSGYWSWFFPKDLCNQNKVLFYYLSNEGVVHYGIDNVEKGLFQGGVKISQPLWPLFDIFGNSSGLRLVDTLPPKPPRPKRKLVPLMLHSTHSRNVRTSKNVAQRLDSRCTQGYVFSDRPIRAGENVLIQCSPNQEERFKGFVHLGVTSCDPADLSRVDLPDNVNQLVDRPEYWVLICDFSNLNCGDEIAMTLTEGGQISFHLNGGGKFKGVVHVDATLKLWIFVNVCGTSQAVHLLTCPEQVKDEEKECVVCYDNAIETALYRCGHTCMCFECAVEQWQGKGDGHCPLFYGVKSQMAELRFHDVHGANVALSPNGHVAQRLQGYGKGLVFSSRPVRVNERVSIKLHKLSNQLSSTVCFGFTSKNPNSLCEDIHYSYLDVFKLGCYWIWPLFKTMCVENTVLFYYVTKDGHVHFGVDGQEINSFYKRVYTGGPLWAILDIDGVSTTVEVLKTQKTISDDDDDEEEEDIMGLMEPDIEELNPDELCTVCCQKEINSVLYKCGHMCMCYQCAMQQKQGAGNGQCPICRAVIKDVIRTYK